MFHLESFGPPCPQCNQKTAFMGVESSWFRNAWVEVYMCPQHGHRFEEPVKRNKHDQDYKEPPFEGGALA